MSMFRELHLEVSEAIDEGFQLMATKYNKVFILSMETAKVKENANDQAWGRD